jgi:hypothetical protein
MFDRHLGVAARRRRTIDSRVRQGAEASVEAICRLVADRIESMTICEARGYVRARAAGEIRRQTRLAFSQQPGVDPGWESLIVLRATERVGPLTMRQLASEREQPLQLRTRPARRAA